MESKREADAAGAKTVAVPVPDEVRETWLEVRGAGGEVVTVLEILSPGNKRAGPGRTAYEEKRLRVLGTRTHLVEIDLLRAVVPMPLRGSVGPSHYRILVSRGERRPSAELFSFSVRQRIPTFRLPLRGHEEPVVDLRAMLDVVYDTGAYGESIDYRTEPRAPAGRRRCEVGAYAHRARWRALTAKSPWPIRRPRRRFRAAAAAARCRSPGTRRPPPCACP